MGNKNSLISTSFRPSQEVADWLDSTLSGGGSLSKSQLIEIAVRFLMGLSRDRLEKVIGMSRRWDELSKYAKFVGEIVDLSDDSWEAFVAAPHADKQKPKR